MRIESRYTEKQNKLGVEEINGRIRRVRKARRHEKWDGSANYRDEEESVQQTKESLVSRTEVAPIKIPFTAKIVMSCRSRLTGGASDVRDIKRKL